MDFSPRPRGFNAPDKRLEFDETAAMLLRQAQAVCSHLLPAGRLRNGEWEVGSPAGEPGKSMKVNIKEGIWKDFDSGVGGHDLIALWAEVRGIRPKEAKEEAEAWLGVDTGRSNRAIGLQAAHSSEAARPMVAPAAGSSPAPVSTPSHTDDDPDWHKKIPASKIWDYFDRDGVLFGQVYRYDHPTQKGVKAIRPWDGHDWKAPEGTRPLYNLPAILKAPRDATIVLVEGEKCADAVNDLRMPLIVATTIWGGAAAASRTDFSPLTGKRVLRWGDNDHPRSDPRTGQPVEVARSVWLRTTLEHLTKANVASLRDVEVDPAMPDGWDAADANPTVRIAHIDRGMSTAPVFEGVARVSIATRTARLLFHGKSPPPMEWLVDRTFPYGRGGTFAAAGGAGKGMLMLDLAVKIATDASSGFDANPLTAFGHTIPKRGHVAILSAEDDEAEIHRRLMSIYPNLPDHVWDRLHIMCYPDIIGRDSILLQGEVGEVKPTQELVDVVKDLKEIPDLRLTVFDPLHACANVNLIDPGSAQIVGNTFDKIAKTLACTVIASHHFTKGDRKAPIQSASDARHSIGGAGQLLNAMRFAYAMWQVPDDHAQRVMRTLDREHTENAVYRGGVVKINSDADWGVQTFVRNANTGLLEIVPWEAIRMSKLVDHKVSPDEAAMVRHCIETWNRLEMPVTQSEIVEDGTKGKWREHMPRKWQEMPRSDRLRIIKGMEAAGDLVKSNKGSLLCIPGDDYALGPDGGGKSPAQVRAGARVRLIWNPKS